MEIYLINTVSGLIPASDEDYELKQRLKIGGVYKCPIKLARNYEFHKKYFSLINTAWAYQNEKRQDHFKNSVTQFRKTVEMAAGHCDTVYNLDLKSWVDTPKSVSFEDMDELEFQDLYERVKDVLWKTFLTHISPEEFERNFIGY